MGLRGPNLNTSKIGADMRRQARIRAQEKGVPYELHDWRPRIPEICPVLGIPLIRGPSGGHAASPTLDRLVPELGYTPANVRVISMRANDRKGDYTFAQLRKKQMELNALVDWLARELRTANLPLDPASAEALANYVPHSPPAPEER